MKDSGRCLNFTSEIMFRQFVNFFKKIKIFAPDRKQYSAVPVNFG